VQRVHNARDELAEGAKSNPTHHPEGDRADGSNRSQKVSLHTSSVKAEHLRGCHDFEVNHDYYEMHIKKILVIWTL
jgi:hypothetical protein